jgi:hypothetical protein
MKLTLILDPAASGLRASLVEEWDEAGRAVRMAPMVRLFDSEEQALAWGRAWAKRRRLGRLYLTDNRGSRGSPAG